MPAVFFAIRDRRCLWRFGARTSPRLGLTSLSQATAAGLLASWISFSCNSTRVAWSTMDLASSFKSARIFSCVWPLRQCIRRPDDLLALDRSLKDAVALGEALARLDSVANERYRKAVAFAVGRSRPPTLRE
jgi:hypothetical protein